MPTPGSGPQAQVTSTHMQQPSHTGVCAAACAGKTQDYVETLFSPTTSPKFSNHTGQNHLEKLHQSHPVPPPTPTQDQLQAASPRDLNCQSADQGKGSKAQLEPVS